MDVQLNIRCTEQTAAAIKRLAESAGLKLGALLEKMIASYQPDSALLPADSNALADLRAIVTYLESRLSALENRQPTIPAPDSGMIADDSKGASNPDQDRFKAAVLQFWKDGLRGYGPIANALTAAGYRNSNGNPYGREMVKRTLVKAGLVTVSEPQ